jgi:hypothetical protein
MKHRAAFVLLHSDARNTAMLVAVKVN